MILRLVCLAAALAVASPAAAQSRFEISGGVTWTGGFDAGGLDAQETRNPSTGTTPLTLFRTSSRVDSAPGASARAAFYVTPRFALEGLAEFSRPTLRTTILDDFESATGTEAVNTLTSYLFGGSVLYHFSSGRIAPFVSGGAGWLRQLDEDRVTMVTGTELHAGGGVKYRLSRHVVLRMDAGMSSRDDVIAFEKKRRTMPVVVGGLGFRW